MIRVRELVHTILYDKKEMYNRQHSNEELINALNLVLNFLNLALINAGSDYIVKEKDVSLRNGKVKLPDDFAKFRGVENQLYDGKIKIVGDVLYLDSNETISYYYILDKIETIEDEIDLPFVFFALLARYTGGILDGTLQSDQLAAALSAEVDKLNSSNTSGPIIRPMQFYV
ncbi:hypothetical protein [uncultured Veillonella sp.]|jgi:hypothetical protein|uniref:hypothetical protein n=1 Tax=Veillonella seminalis TaxID=1502943 RepID=UPI0027DADD37|nr:hypothetical protein [uncultured Veillonella sp.]